MNMYRAIGERIGTLEARELAEQLVAWHDAMVKHLRLVERRAADCEDGCPHEEARVLWNAARRVFGEATAASLTFLRRHGASPVQQQAEAGA
ncbi:MAG TPA: hypothetical protein VIL25_11760 [Vicinamibacterales bacterium]